MEQGKTKKQLIIKTVKYKGKEAAFNSNGKSLDEVKETSVFFGLETASASFVKIMGTIRMMNFNVVELVEAYEETDEGYKKMEKIPNYISLDFKKRTEKPEKEKSDKEVISELKAQMEALLNKNKEEEDALTEARGEYEDLAGRKPHHKWNLSTVLDKIEEVKKEKK